MLCFNIPILLFLIDYNFYLMSNNITRSAHINNNEAIVIIDDEDEPKM